MVMRMGKCQDISVLLVVTRGRCFGAPRLFQSDENHNLEVQSWDLQRPVCLDNPAGPPVLAGFRFLADASYLPSVSPHCRLFGHANCSKVFK